VKEETEERWKILKGMMLGGLLGSVGGPAGFIAGVFAGTTITTLAEISHYNFSADFISKVEQRMAADTVAVITETGELSDAFINDYIKPFDAIVIKANINLPADNNYSKVIDENQRDIEEAVVALKKGADRNAARAAIGELKEKRKSIVTAFDAFDTARFHSMTSKSVVAD
jgi:predicted RNA-binding protein with PIN domain